MFRLEGLNGVRLSDVSQQVSPVNPADFCQHADESIGSSFMLPSPFCSEETNLFKTLVKSHPYQLVSTGLSPQMAWRRKRKNVQHKIFGSDQRNQRCVNCFGKTLRETDVYLSEKLDSDEFSEYIFLMRCSHHSVHSLQAAEFHFAILYLI